MKFGRSIGQGFENELCRHFICAAFGIDQLQIVRLADQQRELRQVGNGSIRPDRQRDSRTGFVNSGLARVLFPLTPSFVRSTTLWRTGVQSLNRLATREPRRAVLGGYDRGELFSRFSVE